MTFPPAELILGGEAILAVVALGGAGLGAIVSGMVAKDVPKHELAGLEADIARRKVLLMVDVPKRKIEQWQALIKQHHPEAEIKVAKLPKA